MLGSERREGAVAAFLRERPHRSSRGWTGDTRASSLGR